MGDGAEKHRQRLEQAIRRLVPKQRLQEFLTSDDGLSQTFPTTIDMLAGNELPWLPEDTPHEELRDSLFEQANALYTSQVWPEAAREVFAKKGITSDTIERWGLGYAPDTARDTTLDLLTRGFPLSSLVREGITGRRGKYGEEISDLYDRFRNRIMFPIYDARGRQTGYVGRTIEQREPKFLFPPKETDYGASSRDGAEFFNIGSAAESARREGLVYLCEGFWEPLVFSQLGIMNVVGNNGTNFTPQRAGRLKDLKACVRVVMDGDQRGIIAMVRTSLTLLQAGLEHDCVLLPAGLDVDEYLVQHAQPRQAFEALPAHSHEKILFAAAERFPERDPTISAYADFLKAVAGTFAYEKDLRTLPSKIQHLATILGVAPGVVEAYVLGPLTEERRRQLNPKINPPKTLFYTMIQGYVKSPVETREKIRQLVPQDSPVLDDNQRRIYATIINEFNGHEAVHHDLNLFADREKDPLLRMTLALKRESIAVPKELRVAYIQQHAKQGADAANIIGAPLLHHD